ncbi:hypothetical protein ACJVC5_11685 [Peredibacter sp. HCB2-198]|uniref:hypothetical protein n=1 Tax=Peredibacter sp. HCB2-198 TaxID=3383025 RepID=UPI0038B61BCF
MNTLVRMLSTTALRYLPAAQPQRMAFKFFGPYAALGALGGFALYKAYKRGNLDPVVRQANEYFPIQSSSERAAGHPIVGSY